MKGRISIYPTVQQLCVNLSREITDFLLSSAGKDDVYIALSGGNTPLPLFQELAAQHLNMLHSHLWSDVHFFWVDERCVPPSHEDSNYRNAHDHFFRKLGIDEEHIHRIRGENDPDIEAKRYAIEVKSTVPAVDDWPSFDWILLGLGEDGHTASLFPDRMDLATSEKLFESVIHPKTQQARITMTPRLINNASRISFLVTGTSKHAILSKMNEKRRNVPAYPADMIQPAHGTMEWWMDEKAATLSSHGK